jgi:hypothetical protein
MKLLTIVWPFLDICVTCVCVCVFITAGPSTKLFTGEYEMQYWLISHNIILYLYENSMQSSAVLQKWTLLAPLSLLLSEKMVHCVSVFVLTDMKHSTDLE